MLRSSIRVGQVCLQNSKSFTDMDEGFEPTFPRHEAVIVTGVPTDRDEMITVCPRQECGCPDIGRAVGMWPEELRLIQPNTPSECNWLQRSPREMSRPGKNFSRGESDKKPGEGSGAWIFVVRCDL